MPIVRDIKGRFVKGNSYWLNRKDKKGNKGSFKTGNKPWNFGKKIDTIRVCENCNKEFDTRKNNQVKSKQRFCSHKCSAEYKHKNNNQPLCLICGKKIKWESVYCRDCYKNENHHWWKGGITPKNIEIRASKKYKKWREVVFERDNYTCQKCKKKGMPIQAHHVKSFAKYPELRFVVSNGLTLCIKCHKKTNNYLKCSL